MKNARGRYGGIFDYDAKERRLEELVKLSEDPALWNDAQRAQEVGRERKILEGIVVTLKALDSDMRDAQELFAMARSEKDENTLIALEQDAAKLGGVVEDMEFRRMFSNPMDPNNCFLDIQAGSGGTEAQDWASILERMYLRYSEIKKFRVEVLEESEGDIAGIKSASLKISGEYAYGHLRTESGVHRLVRKSPFDANSRRHTSFASVFVYPEVDDSIEIEINPADLRVDTYRASGAGGQHINKTDSAVRITHIPTGIVVQCQSDRSQHRNRAEANAMLKSKLYELELRKRNEKKQAMEDAKTDIGWGTRSAPMCWTSHASRICAPTSKSAIRRLCWTATSTTSSPPASNQASNRVNQQATKPRNEHHGKPQRHAARRHQQDH